MIDIQEYVDMDTEEKENNIVVGEKNEKRRHHGR
jgi:hypothetical protein